MAIGRGGGTHSISMEVDAESFCIEIFQYVMKQRDIDISTRIWISQLYLSGLWHILGVLYTCTPISFKNGSVSR